MKCLLSAIAVLLVFFVVIMIFDVNRFVTVTYRFTSGKLKKSCRFVVLSDLHNKQFGKENKKLLEAIKGQKPDGILIAGDMITAKKEGDLSPALSFIRNLAKEYPVFYGEGNHEYRLELYPEKYGNMYKDFSDGLQGCGLSLMKNCHTDLQEFGISVYGVSIERKYYKRFKVLPMETDYVNALLGKPKKECFNILLAHNPDYYPQYDAWGADLVLSGHVHGGLMRLPLLGGVVSPAIRLFPKYDGGLFEGKKGKMILSRGLGTHTLPIRIFNPGELIVVELEPEK